MRHRRDWTWFHAKVLYEVPESVSNVPSNFLVGLEQSKHLPEDQNIADLLTNPPFSLLQIELAWIAGYNHGCINQDGVMANIEVLKRYLNAVSRKK